MSRLGPLHQASKIQPEVIGLIHDEVISLCQKMYATISGIEIDGIICISLLDTREQQVVKIHKTLKSVVADEATVTTGRSSAYPKIACILSSKEPPSFLERQRKTTADTQVPDFQRDIRELNSLLKEYDSLPKSDSELNQEHKRSKRKRKHPKHRLDVKSCEKDVRTELNAESDFSSVYSNGDDKQEDVGQSKDVIVVKEEPIDPSYQENAGSKETSVPKDCEPEDFLEPRRDENADDQNTGTIYKSIQNSDRDDSSDRTSNVDSAHADKLMSVGDGVHVKSEDTSHDNEYGISVDQIIDKVIKNVSENSQDKCENVDDAEASEIGKNEDVPLKWFYPDINEELGLQVTDNGAENGDTFDTENLNVKDKGNTCDAEKHWLYGLQKNPRQEDETMSDPETRTNDITKMALMERYYQQGSIAHKGYPPGSLQRAEKDPLGRSWIELVKDNVNKYQAALMRGVNKSKKSKEEPPVRSASGLLKSLAAPRPSLLNTEHLKALLKGPPLKIDRGKILGETSKETEPSQGSLRFGASSSGSERSRSTSVSPAPEVKIEVDEVPQYPASESVAGKSTPDIEKQPSGKLESRYPALFNQLQQAKQTKAPHMDQSDSLVNRLPFISFQELFAPTNPMPNSSKLSEFATKQLLEQAKVNPFPSRGNAKKTVWKWKKRQVKPKDGQGQTTASAADNASSQSLTINTSPRNFFTKKRQKLDDNNDTEWTPAGARLEETMEDEPNLDNIDEEAAPRKKITTRLSAGEKPRINFAELENSDIELDEEEEEETIELKTEESGEPPIELVSAYCMHQCGLRFDSFTELKLHEDRCAWNHEVGVGSVEGAGPGAVGAGQGAVRSGPEAVGTSGEDFKCTLCGLDFNQEYRWHYHMVKVHGVAAEKAVLFR